MELKFSKVRDVKTPTRGTSKSAGIDFYVPNDQPILSLRPHSDLLIPSGIRANVLENFMLIAEDKSGVVTSKSACLRAGRQPKPDAFVSPIIVGAKVVDEDYQGEIYIHLINCGDKVVTIYPGMKIAQFILVPVSYAMPVEVPNEELFDSASERGAGALGSTGSY